MKTFDTTELGAFHPLLNRFLEQRYGSPVSGTVVLMATEASKWLSQHDRSIEEHHLQLVETICQIAATVHRPQRIPTFKEWDRFWRMVRDDAAHFAGDELLVRDPDNRVFVEAIVAHERAATLDRIADAAVKTAA